MRYRIIRSTAGQRNKRIILQRCHPVKLTALLYLKEALEQKRYGELKELIDAAREFDLKDQEIGKLFLAD